MKRAVLAAGFLLAAVGASAQPNQLAPGTPVGNMPEALREVGWDQRLGEVVPADLELRDESGRSVRLGDYLGKKPLVLSLVYYECPMLCTLALNGLSSALGVLSFDVGKEFEVLTVSFDPKEGPELAVKKKAAYVGRYKREGAERGWHFLTGDAAQLERLTKAVGFRYAWDEATKQWAHPAGVVTLTPDGRIAHYLFGVEYAPKDLRLSLVEASEGKIGSPVDQVLLYCYQYDPQTGSYGAVIMRIVRLAGVATLAALGTFIFVMLRRDRRTARAAAQPTA
jgi:protein SCO1/2